jgi:hypothetical protein
MQKRFFYEVADGQIKIYYTGILMYEGHSRDVAKNPHLAEMVRMAVRE